MSTFRDRNGMRPPEAQEVQAIQNFKIHKDDFKVRANAHEFPLMIILSVIYPCNFGCPNCPYTDGNSEIRKFYRSKKGDLLPVKLWNKIAIEAGMYGSFLRCTGGGEPMMHPQMPEMIEFAKAQKARVWLNTNGSKFGPDPLGRAKLERVIKAGIDIIEFSMDAGEAEVYAKLRPPISGAPKDPQKWFEGHVGNIRAALEFRKQYRSPTRIVVSMIRQQAVKDRFEDYIQFYLKDVGVDEVITRKFLSWDDNTAIDLKKSMDDGLYDDTVRAKEACVWPFERLNVDTLGRIALCGQDISFKTSERFPNANDVSIKEIWTGEAFSWYRKMHLSGEGEKCFPCKGCSAWHAGIRDWKEGWLKVLDTSGKRLQEVMAQDLGADVQIFDPHSSLIKD